MPYFNTNKPHSFFFRRIPVLLENRRSSRRGARGAHPLHPPPRSAPVDKVNSPGGWSTFTFRGYGVGLRCLIPCIIPAYFHISAATLPTTIRCVEENNKIDPRISRFMLPLGATINMDGLSIARVVATIFIAQLNNISMSPGRIVIVW